MNEGVNERAGRNRIIRTTAVYLALLSPVLLAILIVIVYWRSPLPHRVVICDPAEIGRGAPLVTITDAQCQAIGESVEILKQTEGRSEVLALDRLSGMRTGAPLPDRIDLAPLPRVVTDEWPSLQRYRYFLIEDEIAVADPVEQKVVAFVEVHLSDRR